MINKMLQPSANLIEYTDPKQKRGRSWIPCLRFGLVLLASLCCASASRAADSANNLELFEKRVRPILAINCYGCHGTKKQEAGLRLDSRDAILAGGDNGPAVTPEDPTASLLLQAIRQSGDLKMPPEGKLLDEEIVAIERWIRAGLPWPKRNSDPVGDDVKAATQNHWAFQVIQSPRIPAGPPSVWEQQPIDRFVTTRLQQEGIAPSVLGDRHTLIRRMSFNVTGLPPTADQVAEFDVDTSPDAVERLIDRLLAAPQFGEHWARHWLDVARYADNKGYVFFEEKSYPWAYTYRDYVIRAFNQDLPYDRFVTEQLAADHLNQGENKQSLAALGFLTIGGHFMNNTHDIMDDRIDVVTRGLMGLTVTCARCHDHKYDPVSQAEYYSLYGVFRSCFEPTVPPVLDTPTPGEESDKFTAEMETREKKLVDFVTQKHTDLVHGARVRSGEYLLAAHAQQNHPPTDNFMLLVDMGDLNPAMILRWQVYLEDPRRRTDPVWLVWWSMSDLPAAEFSAKVGERLRAVCSMDAVGNPLVRAAFLAQPPSSMKDVADRYAQVFARVNQQWQEYLQQSVASGLEPPLALPEASDEEVRRVLYGPDAPPDVPMAMDWGFLSLFPDRPTQGEYEKLLKEVEQWMMTGPGAPPRAMALFDSPRPFEPRIFLRGNPHRLGEPVPRQFLKVVAKTPSPFVEGSGRLELARAIVDHQNPLTSRVIVNRLWMHYFGQGIVKTPGDFGLRSEPPSHPELLDWMSSDLMSPHAGSTPNCVGNGVGWAWSLKRLHRQILTSATYQQVSHVRDDGVRIDPENLLLWRSNRHRLEFESMRDAMIMVTGELNRQIGGKPMALLEGWTPRRTIYGSIDRMDTPALLSTFDFPSPAFSSPQRGATTVTPQALYAMNNAFVVEAGSRTARRPELTNISEIGIRLSFLYHVCFGRPPTDDESNLAKGYLGDPVAPERWDNFVQGLLMTNEFIFLD